MSRGRGRLTVIYGPMFSGKTTYLIEKFGDTRESVVFKPDVDSRYSSQPAAISHLQQHIPAVHISHAHPSEMLPLIGQSSAVLIDEANLFSLELIPIIEQLLFAGKKVYVSGLVLDSEQAVWGPMQELIGIADEKIEVFAQCDGEGGKCRTPATLSYCKIPKTEQVLVAGADEYGACCPMHYQALHHSPTKSAKSA